MFNSFTSFVYFLSCSCEDINAQTLQMWLLASFADSIVPTTYNNRWREHRWIDTSNNYCRTKFTLDDTKKMKATEEKSWGIMNTIGWRRVQPDWCPPFWILGREFDDTSFIGCQRIFCISMKDESWRLRCPCHCGFGLRSRNRARVVRCRRARTWWLAVRYMGGWHQQSATNRERICRSELGRLLVIGLRRIESWRGYIGHRRIVISTERGIWSRILVVCIGLLW